MLGKVMLRLMNLTMGTSVCQLMVVSGLPFRVADLKLPLFSREPESNRRGMCYCK